MAGASLLAAAPAAPDSISFLRGGDIWVASPDGATQRQVTHDGGYAHQSQADDGSFIALKGRRLHRIAPDGRVLADFDTPVSGERTDTTSSYFRGPYEPEISPDGKVVAYEYYFTGIENKPGCFPVGDPSCQRKDIHAGVGYTWSDRQTGWDEPGLGRQSGWMDPAWNPDGSVLLSDKTVRFNLDAMVDHPGDGNQTIQGWFLDENTWYFRQAEMNRQGTALMAVTTRPKGAGEDLWEDDQITIYRMNGMAPALPEACYGYTGTGDGGRYFSPTWSPDGTRIAFNNNGATHARRDILIAQVPSQAAGCALPAQGGATVIEGAEYPDWGPADVAPAPAPGPAPVPGPAPGPAPVPGPAPAPAAAASPSPVPAAAAVPSSPWRARPCAARWPRASPSAPRACAAPRPPGGPPRPHAGARRPRTADARGAATTPLRFTAAARRTLRREPRVALVITGAGAGRTVVLDADRGRPSALVTRAAGRVASRRLLPDGQEPTP